MALFRIHGGKKLNGRVEIMGSKNAFLPQLAATLLTREPCILRRVPRIRDGEQMIDILVRLGARIQWKDEHTLRVDCSRVAARALEQPAVATSIKSIRASILLVGPLLARFGAVSLPEPGGCIIGKRPLDTHFFALERLGAVIRGGTPHFEYIASEVSKGIAMVSLETGVPVILGSVTLPAGQDAIAYAINDSGRIAGSADGAGLQGRAVSVVWDASLVQKIHETVFDTAISEVRSINTSGQLSGSFRTETGQLRPFVATPVVLP